MPDFAMLVSLPDMKGHLGLTASQTEDDALISAKVRAAQRFIQRQIGYGFEERFLDPANVPEDLLEAIMQLAAWWYENREAVTDRGNHLPFGVQDIIDANRDMSF